MPVHNVSSSYLVIQLYACKIDLFSQLFVLQYVFPEHIFIFHTQYAYVPRQLIDYEIPFGIMIPGSIESIA